MPGVIVYRFDAPLVFSNAEAFEETGQKLLIDAGATGELPHTMVIDCEGMFYTDFTGAEADSMFRNAKKGGAFSPGFKLGPSGPETAGTIDELGEDRLFDTIRHAVDAATKSRGRHDSRRIRPLRPRPAIR